MSNLADDQGAARDPLVTKYQSRPVPTVLRGMNQIDWPSLHHAYGPAADFPALMTAALSADAEDREDAFELLSGTIWYQGTVFEASAYAVPFLYKALEWPETPDKPGFVGLLCCIADGYGGLQANATSSPEMERIWREILAKEGRVLETEIAREMEYVRLARQAVGERLHLLYPYLQDEQTSCDVARALSFYPERKEETIPLLRAAQAVVRDEYGLQEINSTLQRLAGANDPAI